MHELYKDIYSFADKIPKRDRFGIWAKVESTCLEIFESTIEAAFAAKLEKSRPLITARTKIEILKRLIRLTRDLKILEDKPYLHLEEQLQRISKIVAGWLKFANS